MKEQELKARILQLETENSKLQQQLIEAQEELESSQPDWYALVPVLSRKEIKEYQERDSFFRLAHSIKHEWIKIRLKGVETPLAEVWLRGVYDIVLTPEGEPLLPNADEREDLAGAADNDSHCAHDAERYRLQQTLETVTIYSGLDTDPWFTYPGQDKGVGIDQVKAWLLEQGIDTDSDEWENWMDLIAYEPVDDEDEYEDE
jgi:hypothetical protein